MYLHFLFNIYIVCRFVRFAEDGKENEKEFI
jgi:hypothetical protein